MQPIFLLLEMGAATIPDDMKFHVVVVKYEGLLSFIVWMMVEVSWDRLMILRKH